jgi:hypothetical protein
MAVYKVPQDVEAEDKLIGPFSFRQFIYLIIALVSIAIGWGLGQLFIPLAIIPLPIVILFGALALPLKKDQPMEIYLAAIISFYLKPRRRLWQPDGIQSLVEVIAPKVVEIQRAKSLSQTEAEKRLSYLADLVDTRGWSVRGVGPPAPNSPMQNDAYYAAQQTQDILDDTSNVAQSIDSMISKADTKRHQEMMQKMRQEQPVTIPQRSSTAPPRPDPYATLQPPSTPQPAPDEPRLTYDPYPTSIHQSVINPLGNQPATSSPIPPPATSEKPVSPDIINLANNSDLSIETIAHEANRIHQKEERKDDEVVISLR